MKRINAALLSALSIAVIPQPAIAVENGISAEGDPRIVSLYRGSNTAGYIDIYHPMCTGFLISSRVVATAQHCTMDPNKNQPRDASELYVGRPGVKSTLAVGNHFAVAAVFRAENYRKYDISIDLSFTNDVALLVLAKPISYIAPAKLLNESEFKELINTDPQVWIGGYGYQKASEREIAADRRFTLPAKAPARFAKIEDFQASIAYWKKKFNRANYQANMIGLAMPIATGTLCDGDSGSGFWVQKKSQTIFLGVQNGPSGIPNCFGQPAEFPISYAGVQPTYLYQSTYDEAFDYVQQNPVKITITCKKAKLIKKVKGISPKCPAGYKRT